MRIQINIQRLIGDIRTKSRLELANMQDATARYRIEVGTEKLGEIQRDIESSVSSLVGECYRFLSAPVMDIADNQLSDESKIVFDLIGGARRFDGKEKALAQKIHEVLVDLTMQKYYISVAAGELSKAHEKQAVAGIAELNRLLRQKGVPKYIDAIEHNTDENA